MGQFAHAFCHRAAIGLERGGVRRVLHVQAVFEIGLAHRGDASGVAKVMREKIRKLCGLVGAKVIVKELAPSQSFEREYSVLCFRWRVVPSALLGPFFLYALPLALSSIVDDLIFALFWDPLFLM